MIFGIGVDNCELARIERAITRSETFVRKMMNDAEFARFSKISTKNRRIEFVAGLWAAKEAYAKALGTGYSHGITPEKISVDSDALGKPLISSPFFSGHANVSITHDGGLATAFVTLEFADKM
ncbi:MAG: holo-ACP synthase [Streptococcaceae bacterium]|jgi:holo-[acyl-carrier protein] synthase|nr:holo-ACP synthase [Streptococcaceae bacterium]